MPRRSQIQFIKLSTDTGLALNIKNPKGTPLPPSVSVDAFNAQGGFDPDTVVSRFADGSIASRFKDPSWDFKDMVGATQKMDTMHYPDDKALANEVKTITKLVMLTPTQHQADFSYFTKYYYFLKRLAKFCKTGKTSLKKLFNTKGSNHLVNLIKDQMPFYAQPMIIISEYLDYMHEEVGFEHGFKPLSKTARARLRKIYQEYQADCTQNPVIPSRILKTIYHDTIAEYEALLPVLDELLAMQTEIDLHPMVGLALSSQKNNCQKFFSFNFGKLKINYPTNFDLAKKYPLARDFLNLNFNHGKAKPHDNGYDFDVLYDRNNVLFAINYIQRVCQDMIIMFTGMRPAEAALLPYFGSKKTTIDGVKYWLIYGFAMKKRTGNPPFEMWVTNEFGYQAFQTAKRVADLFYARNQRQPIENIPDEDLMPDLSPLFLQDNDKIVRRDSSHKKTPALANSYLITKADFDELKMINPHQKWESKPEFSVRKPFPVELQYFRRSVAFFASASGVRLVDLKNQLHHLFDSQTFYYGQGSGRANPFLQNKDSFASYFNQIKHEAKAFSFINQVINFDGKLFGASATYAERNQAFYNNIREEDRIETIKRFKRGELSYTVTQLGGCKTIAPCKNKALGSVIACLECKDADIKPEKLAHAIKDQSHLVDSLDTQRLEFRTEIQELIKMLDFAIKNISRAIKTLDRRKTEYKQFNKRLKEFKKLRTNYLKEIEKYGWGA